MLSEWFKHLDATNQEMVRRMLDLVAQQSVFGFLSVLDGTRQIEHAEGQRGYLELRYIKQGKEEILSGPKGKILHELLD